MVKWDWPEDKQPPRQREDARVADLVAQVATMQRDMQQMQARASMSAGDTKYELENLGMRKAWQESQADNVDSLSPLKLFVYIPPRTKSVNQVRLRLLLQPFRSYSKATKLSLESAQQTNSITGTIWELSSPTSADMMTSAPSHRHSGSTDPGGADLHSHTFDTSSNGSHAHGLSRHSHYYTMAPHQHDSEPGIYTGLPPDAVSIKINGTNRDAALGGPFTADIDDLDIRQYLVTEGWHTIEFVSIADPATNPNGLGRLYAVVFVDLYLPG